jgi:DNA-binding transcriptional LysR family regulator
VREVNRAAERGYFDVRIGAVDSVATFVLPEAFAKLLEVFPHLSVKLVSGRTQALLQRVRLGELDLALVAHSGAPREVRNDRVSRYNLRYFGRKTRFPSLARVTRLEELSNFPIVELEPPPGVAPVVPEGAFSHALVSGAATVKGLIFAGVGVGDLPDFMLTKKDLKELVAARIPHDPDCGIFLARSAAWSGSVEDKVATELIGLLRGALK